MDLEDRLTRLYLNGGVSAGHYSFSFSEYYFYAENGHILNLNLARNFDFLTLGLSANYDSFTTPVNKTVAVNSTLRPLEVLELRADYRYDWERKLSSESTFGLIYKPRNNCWMLDTQYSKSRVEKVFSFNILINFNDNSFTSLSGS